MVDWSRAWERERLEDKGQGGLEEEHVAGPTEVGVKILSTTHQ